MCYVIWYFGRITVDIWGNFKHGYQLPLMYLQIIIQ